MQLEEPKEARKLWVDVLSDNRNPIKGMFIEFVAPKLVNEETRINTEDAYIKSELKFWETSLLMD